MRLKNAITAAALTSAAMAATGLFATSAFATGSERCPAPNVIHAAGPEVFPHSGDYDPNTNTFYVGSLKHSTISAVSVDGTVRTAVDDPALISVAAVHVDARRDRLVASAVDYGLADHSTKATTFHVAGVAAYDKRTGRRLWPARR